MSRCDSEVSRHVAGDLVFVSEIDTDVLISKEPSSATPIESVAITKEYELLASTSDEEAKSNQREAVVFPVVPSEKLNEVSIAVSDQEACKKQKEASLIQKVDVSVSFGEALKIKKKPRCEWERGDNLFQGRAAACRPCPVLHIQ
jgi:hypothetical protein